MPSASKMRRLAERLNAYEAVENRSRMTNAPPAFRVCEKLRRPLVKLAGSGGFRALLFRAMALARTEVRWLLTIEIETDGTLGFPPSMARMGKEEIAEAEVALAARVIELLVVFIGEPMTLTLVQDIWPTITFSEIDSNKETPTGKET